MACQKGYKEHCEYWGANDADKTCSCLADGSGVTTTNGGGISGYDKATGIFDRIIQVVEIVTGVQSKSKAEKQRKQQQDRYSQDPIDPTQGQRPQAGNGAGDTEKPNYVLWGGVGLLVLVIIFVGYKVANKKAIAPSVGL